MTLIPSQMHGISTGKNQTGTSWLSLVTTHEFIQLALLQWQKQLNWY